MIRNRLATYPISFLLIATTCLVPWNASQAAWIQQKATKTESAPTVTRSTSPDQGSLQTHKPVKPESGGSNDPSSSPVGTESSPSPESQSQVGPEGEAAGSPETTEGPASEENPEVGESGTVDSESPASTEGAPSQPGSALPPPELSPDLGSGSDEPKVGKRSATGKGLLVAGISAAGLGLAMLGTSIGITQCNYDGPLQCKYATQRSLFIPTSLAVTLTAAVLVGAGLGFRARYKKWEQGQGRDKAPPKKTALVPAYLRGGAALIYTTEF